MKLRYCKELLMYVSFTKIATIFENDLPYYNDFKNRDYCLYMLLVPEL